MLQIDELKKKLDDESFVVMSCQDFLKRETNNFDNNLSLAVYDIFDYEKVYEKIEKFFGNANIKTSENFILIKPKKMIEREVFSFGDLVEIIWRLRDENGCPWDKAQTNMTIRGNAIEEAYELVEAIELDDNEKIAEESGDVLLQGLFNAIIAEQEGKFSTNDMINGLCKKLITRHTHIFGNEKAKNSEEALKCWEEAKAVEKNQQSITDKIDAIPKTFSALMKAYKVQKTIKKTGFEFPTINEAYDKINEEIVELKNAEGEEIENECGDLLFSAINVIRMNNVDPELALNGTTNRFIKRFSYIEKKAKENNKDLKECNLEEMEKWYQESKKYENR